MKLPVLFRGNGSTVPKEIWPSLWALAVGFFLVIVDATIVPAVTPALMNAFRSDVSSVLWVTSAYLLAFTVPLLITGRLGDRFGPRRIYLLGLAIFTLASLWCGLAGSIMSLIMARIVQGLGASLMAPQNMTVMARTTPAESRGQANVLWGAAAGLAAIVGPIVGLVLIDSVGWQWIFLINIPIGLAAFAMAWRYLPVLERLNHSFDFVGVALSCVGLFCVIFAIQEGDSYHWGQITGILSIPTLFAVGVTALGIFVWWQRYVKTEPLVPLSLFKNRNFSLASLAIMAVGFFITAMLFPLMIYAQAVLGFTPMQAALVMAPEAMVTIALTYPVGKLIDRVHPRYLAGPGLFLLTVLLFALAHLMKPDTPLWQLLVLTSIMGIATSFVWGPLAVAANLTLPHHLAGAGSGVYNTTRHLGSVIGSAAIAAAMTSRIATADTPTAMSMDAIRNVDPHLRESIAQPLSQAFSQSMLLPAAAIAVAWVAAMFFQAPSHWLSKDITIDVSDAAIATTSQSAPITPPQRKKLL